jgi:hypothetical protein
MTVHLVEYPLSRKARLDEIFSAGLKLCALLMSGINFEV